MALQTTGTIKHSQIMAEFEKTGKFALSADGAALIDKTTGQIIKESDFYGASARASDEGGFGDPAYQCWTAPTWKRAGDQNYRTNQKIGSCGWLTEVYGGNNQAAKSHQHGWRLGFYVFHGTMYNWDYHFKTRAENRDNWQTSITLFVRSPGKDYGLTTPIVDQPGTSFKLDASIGNIGKHVTEQGHYGKLLVVNANYYKDNAYTTFINDQGRCEAVGDPGWYGYFPETQEFVHNFDMKADLRNSSNGDKYEPMIYASCSSQLYSSTKYPRVEWYKMIIRPK
jgi:hypothetical protein